MDILIELYPHLSIELCPGLFQPITSTNPKTQPTSDPNSTKSFHPPHPPPLDHPLRRGDGHDPDHPKYHLVSNYFTTHPPNPNEPYLLPSRVDSRPYSNPDMEFEQFVLRFFKAPNRQYLHTLREEQLESLRAYVGDQKLSTSLPAHQDSLRTAKASGLSLQGALSHLSQDYFQYARCAPWPLDTRSRFEAISASWENLDYTKSPLLLGSGIAMNRNAMTVNGRILKPPQIQFNEPRFTDLQKIYTRNGHTYRSSLEIRGHICKLGESRLYEVTTQLTS
ncbi:hypothetical protein BDN72DRAFT_946490 [Pluteus cervinus]|uniref:Uncharacterized protein n=1 Tax=Pluteus cervinus TaxID=181527 RepID=A0ACD3A0P4_9AGAR|nr:hypothetical protein BDN72DRAFT_946490 [Pluteus cervinus]